MKRRIYVDSGVLIAYVRTSPSVAARIAQFLADPEREFLSSEFVRLETLPKAIFHRNDTEIAFYERFFRQVTEWAALTRQLVDEAFTEASLSGMSGIDALHVVSANLLKADELVTTESVEKPMFRTTRVRVVPLSEYL